MPISARYANWPASNAYGAPLGWPSAGTASFLVLLEQNRAAGGGGGNSSSHARQLRFACSWSASEADPQALPREAIVESLDVFSTRIGTMNRRTSFLCLFVAIFPKVLCALWGLCVRPLFALSFMESCSRMAERETF
jgi:hypothetical protein